MDGDDHDERDDGDCGDAMMCEMTDSEGESGGHDPCLEVLRGDVKKETSNDPLRWAIFTICDDEGIMGMRGKLAETAAEMVAEKAMEVA